MSMDVYSSAYVISYFQLPALKIAEVYILSQPFLDCLHLIGETMLVLALSALLTLQPAITLLELHSSQCAIKAELFWIA